MYISPLTGSCNRKEQNNQHKQIRFKSLLPQGAKIKLAFFDIDETLINWSSSLSKEEEQSFRNVLFKYLRQNKIKSVYTSDRGITGIMPLIENGKLEKSDYIVGNNGGFIYQGKDSKFNEIKSYSTGISNIFNKTKVRTIMADIAHIPENMFTPTEWAKVPPKNIPEGQKEFRGSKITEYVGQESPLSIRFCLAPNIYEQNLERIKTALKANNISAHISFFHYPANDLTYKGLQKYITPTFTKQAAIDLLKHYIPRKYPDGTADSILISATDKGTASEYIRNSLDINTNEVFAAGDGENDFTNSNKGYYFPLLSNASAGLRKMITQPFSPTNIIETDKPGVEGIIDVLI